jgi:hypothetical protein
MAFHGWEKGLAWARVTLGLKIGGEAMRTVCLALLVLLISVECFAQAQTNLPAVLHSDQAKSQPHKPGDSGVEQAADVKAIPKGTLSEEWYSLQSDQLLQALACFLDKQSIDNQLAAESKKNLSAPTILAARVKLLAVLVQRNSRNHCQ